MRKPAGFILLMAFMIAQYARQASYLECRLSNYFSNPAAQCDCEKVLVENKNTGDRFPLPALHHHTHVDESYFPAPVSEDRNLFAGAAAIFCSGDHGKPGKGVHSTPERPPAI